MNGVFFKLRAEFQPDENYTGKDIIKEILETIRVSPSCLRFTNRVERLQVVHALAHWCMSYVGLSGKKIVVEACSKIIEV